MIFEIILGLIPAIPAFLVSRTLFLRGKPVVHKVSPSQLTPVIEAYRQKQLEIEGKVAPAAIETSTPEKPVKGKTTIMSTNYNRWSKAKAQVPLVVESVKILEALSSMSSLDLDAEELHNVEVLSNQTDELLTNFFQTPESIRTMPAVQAALAEQLKEIEVGVNSVTGIGAEDIIRKANISTSFLKSKFSRN